MINIVIISIYIALYYALLKALLHKTNEILLTRENKCNNEETFHQKSPEILNSWKCLFATAHIVICLTCTHLRPHGRMLPVARKVCTTRIIVLLSRSSTERCLLRKKHAQTNQKYYQIDHDFRNTIVSNHL